MRPLRVEDAGRMGFEGDGEGLAAEKRARAMTSAMTP